MCSALVATLWERLCSLRAIFDLEASGKVQAGGFGVAELSRRGWGRRTGVESVAAAQGFFESRRELATACARVVIAFILDQRHDLDSILAASNPGLQLTLG